VGKVSKWRLSPAVKTRSSNVPRLPKSVSTARPSERSTVCPCACLPSDAMAF
jgi:hypothetical protein